MPLFDLNKKVWQWFTILLLAVIWGSSFILMKKGLVVFNYNQVANVRIFVSFIALLPIALKNISKIEKPEWKYLLIVGLCGTGIPAFLFAKAQTEINSSLAGMLNSLVPLFTLAIAMIVFGQKFNTSKFLGVIIGLIGAIGLLGLNNIGNIDKNSIYGLLIVLATICYAISVNVIKKYLYQINAVTITSVSMIFIGPPAGFLLFSSDFTERLSWNPDVLLSLAAICALSLFGTALAIIVFNLLIKKVSALFATSVTYLIPIISMLWGYIDNEVISITQVISISIILCGVYLLNKK